MAIETFEFIDDLVAANPTATDNVSEGDDHLRGLKTTLKNTFPNVDGAVNSTQAELNILDGVTATTTELNYVDGVTSSIQTQLGNINTDLLNDTTPQLGGNLDLNSKNITGTGTIPSANLTGALPAISGAALTNLPVGTDIHFATKTVATASRAIGTTYTNSSAYPMAVQIKGGGSSANAIYGYVDGNQVVISSGGNVTYGAGICMIVRGGGSYKIERSGTWAIQSWTETI